MIIVGLTGPSGSGKSEVASFLRELGIAVCDADFFSRVVMNVGHDCYNETVAHFSEDILNDDLTVNRKKLASIVFSDKAQLDVLNSITHKHILAEFDKFAKTCEDAGGQIIVFDAPQLFESKFNEKCSYVVSVLSDRETRLARIMSRDGISATDADKRFASQLDEAFFTLNSDYVIYNDSTVEELRDSVLGVFGEIGKKENIDI